MSATSATVSHETAYFEATADNTAFAMPNAMFCRVIGSSPAPLPCSTGYRRRPPGPNGLP